MEATPQMAVVWKLLEVTPEANTFAPTCTLDQLRFEGMPVTCALRVGLCHAKVSLILRRILT